MIIIKFQNINNVFERDLYVQQYATTFVKLWAKAGPVDTVGMIVDIFLCLYAVHIISFLLCSKKLLSNVAMIYKDWYQSY